MKFQWYIINVVDSTVQGSNDVDEIKGCLESDDYILLTAQHGKFFCGSPEEHEVEEFGTPQTGDDEDEDDEDEVRSDPDEHEVDPDGEDDEDDSPSWD